MRSPLLLTGPLVLALTLGAAQHPAAAQPPAPPRPVSPQSPKVWRIESPPRAAGSGPNYVFLDNGRPMQISTFGQERGYLGIQLIDLTPDLRAYFGAAPETGVLVSSVEPESPAAVAGLKAGDVVIAADGDSIGSSFGLAREIGRRAEGEQIQLDVLRDHTRQRVVAVVSQRERPQVDVGFMFHTCDDESEECTAAAGRGPSPGPGAAWDFIHGDRVGSLSLDPDHFADAIHELEARMESPEWRAKVTTFQDRIGQLEKRIQDLERRLEEREED
jgi:PDZ domain